MAAAQGIDRPLDTFELMFYAMRDVARLNMVGVVELRGHLPTKALRPALDALQQAHPLLRSRVWHGSDGPRWVDAPDAPPVALEVRPRAGPAAWVPEAEALLERPFDLGCGGAAAIVVLEGREQHDILLGIDHLLGDGATVLGALRQLLAAAGRIAAGDTPGLPVHPPPPALSEIAPFRLGTPEAHRAAQEVARRAHGEAGRTHREVLADQVPGAKRRTRFVPRSLSVATTEALVAHCRAEGTTVTGLLGAAFLQALAEDTGPGRFVLNTTVNLRKIAPHAPSETLSFYDMTTADAFDVAPGVAPWTLARELRATLEPAAFLHLWGTLAALEDHRAQLLQASLNSTAPRPPRSSALLVLTSVGRAEGPPGTATWDRVHVAGSAAGVSLPVVLTAGTGAAGLAFNIVHPAPAFSETRMNALADRVQDFLENAKNPASR